jgi:hypothetical protein
MGLLVRGNPVTPGAPGTVTCVATGVSQSTISVEGTGSAPAGWRSWEIFESPTSGGTFVSIATDIPPQAMPYQRTGLGPGVTRWYKVRGTTNDGQFTAQSAEDSGTTSAASSAFAPLFPRIGWYSISNPFNYDDAAFKTHLAKHHIAIFTHFSQMQAIRGWSNSLSTIMGQIKAAAPGSMSVVPRHLIYIVNNENFNNQPGERQRVKLDSERWWLYPTGTSGTPVTSSYSVDLWLVNNTRFCPTDSGGDNWIEWHAKLMYQQNVIGEPGNAANTNVDGFFLDNTFKSFRVNADYNRDGTQDSALSSVTALWQREGLADTFDYLRTLWPSMKWVGGNIADLPDGNSAISDIAPLNGKMDVGVSEALIGESFSVYTWGGFTEMLRWMRFNEDLLIGDKAQICGAKLTSETAYREARFAMCSFMVGCDGYLQLYVDYASNRYTWFDEYDNAGASMEYLGAWTDARQTAPNQNGVYRRRAANGAVYVNPTSSAQNVTAYRNLRRINGTQDPAVNSGATIANGATISIPAFDGLVLLNN